MKTELDPGPLAFAGSKTRVLTLGVLANAERPMTGYRVAKTAGLAPIKVYGGTSQGDEGRDGREGSRRVRACRQRPPFVLARKVRIFWSGDLVNSSRADRAARAKALPTDWYDPSILNRYVELKASLHGREDEVDKPFQR